MKDIQMIIVGVGGQGTLLASRIMGTLAQDNGLDVKLSEVHGMAQRGGSVITHVRMGEQVASPLVEAGSADAVIAFEALEGLRALPFLKKGGTIIVNSQKILPMPVLMGNMAYPADFEETLKASGNAVLVDGLSIAEACGNTRAVNVVMLGVLSVHLPFEEAAWQAAIKKCVPPKAIELNQQAFQKGRALALKG